MRHRKSGRAFSRTSAHRKAMFSNMVASLVEHELIKTTLPKAKELRRYIEPLITSAKQDSVAKRRQAFSRLRNRAAVQKLFNELGPRFSDRPGGYTRVLKCGYRPGDSAPMAIIEFVERPEKSQALVSELENMFSAAEAELNENTHASSGTSSVIEGELDATTHSAEANTPSIDDGPEAQDQQPTNKSDEPSKD